MSDCIWRGSQEPRALRHRHDEDGCLDQFGEADDSCRGCAPCPHAHCIVCGIEHKLGACPGCTSSARDDLWELSRLMSRVDYELTAAPKAPKSGAMSDVPAGELMYLAGPVADLGYHAARTTLAIHRGQRHPNDEHDSDGEHPWLLLAFWEGKWRHLRGEGDALVSTGGTDYLDRMLSWAADNEPHFEEFSKGLSQQVTRIEDALLEGERDAFGAPCLTCGRRQIRKFGETPAEDRWKCAHCQISSTPAQYLLSEGEERRGRATRLTANDMQIRFGVKPGTLWKWASDGDVGKRGMNGNGHKMYDVAHVQAMLKKRDTDESQGVDDSEADVS